MSREVVTPMTLSSTFIISFTTAAKRKRIVRRKRIKRREKKNKAPRPLPPPTACTYRDSARCYGSTNPMHPPHAIPECTLAPQSYHSLPVSVLDDTLFINVFFYSFYFFVLLIIVLLTVLWVLLFVTKESVLLFP